MTATKSVQWLVGFGLAGLFVMGSGCAKWKAEREAKEAAEREAKIAATQPVVPDAIRVDGPAAFVLHAVGNQVYVWEQSGAGGGEWKLKEPAAKFWCEDNAICGKHYAGPTWELSDGSKITAKREADAPSPDADAIPWLLLKVTSHQGNGKLATITHVQRINTKGGLGPSTPGTKAGEEMRVPYAADYVFRVSAPVPATQPAVEPTTQPAQ